LQEDEEGVKAELNVASLRRGAARCDGAMVVNCGGARWFFSVRFLSWRERKERGSGVVEEAG
jgi:hypothetical protein